MPRQKAKSKHIILGLTGSFGSGKTTVARILHSLGARVIDADRLAHGSLARGKPAYRKAVRVFGRDILKKDSSIDRRKLAAKVFCDRKLLSRLNRIIHPEVIRKIEEEIRNSAKKVIVLDVPLLVEAGLKNSVDKLIVVSVSPSTQIKRAGKKTGLNRREISRRIRCQLPLAIKIRLADFVIDNNGSLSKTKKQVKQVWQYLKNH
jgi:dephospho-CoA kinase